jgi:hypothetical protein
MQKSIQWYFIKAGIFNMLLAAVWYAAQAKHKAYQQPMHKLTFSYFCKTIGNMAVFSPAFFLKTRATSLTV